MKNNNPASSTSPDKQSQLIKLTPLATRREISSPVASAECPGTDERDPIVAMLFADNTIRSYDTKSLAPIGPVIDLRARAPHAVICSVDDSTVVTGGAEGCLVVSDVQTGRVSAAFQAHNDAVVSIDSWLDYVISVGRDNILKLFRFVNGELLPTRFEEKKLLFAPLHVKLIMDGGIMMALVTSEKLKHTQVFRMDVLHLYCPIQALLKADLLADFRLVDLAVNQSHTLLVAVVENTSCVKIMVGDFNSFVWLEGCVISTVKDVYRASKVYWSTTDSRVWVTNNDGTVKGVEVAKLPEVPALSNAMSEVVCLQVCCVADREVIITGGRHGEVTLWE